VKLSEKILRFFIGQGKEGWTWIGNIYHLFIPTEWCNTERPKEHFFMMEWQIAGNMA
jgi:hypothetical protein